MPRAAVESGPAPDGAVPPTASVSSVPIKSETSVVDVVVDELTDVVVDELTDVVVDELTDVLAIDVPAIDDAVVVVDRAAAPTTGAMVPVVAGATDASEVTCTTGGSVGAGAGGCGTVEGDGAAARTVVVGGGALDGAPQSEPLRGLGA